MKFNEGFEEHKVGLVHHFCSTVYAKETRIPAGLQLEQHAHTYDHLSILAKGWVNVVVDGETKEYRAPACIKIAAHKRHSVVALTEAVWFCIHGSADEQDADRSLVEDQAT